MIELLATIIALASSDNNPISSAVKSYRNAESYSVTLRSRHDGYSEEIRYYYKKPGFIRMEFITPHKGAVLVYNPDSNEVRLRPFDFLKPLILTLKPDNALIRSARGHTVDKSDIGALLEMVRKLQSNGKTDVLGNETTSGKKAILVSVEGEGDFTVESIHRYVLWLDTITFLPLKVVSHGLKGEIIEEVVMDDLEINPVLPEVFFLL